MEMEGLSHISSEGHAAMVDVGHKEDTHRRAVAEALVRLPDRVLELLSDGELHSAKGPVLHTARIAGIMAAKRTSDWIPLCHPLGLDVVEIQYNWTSEGLQIVCEARLKGRTGVEMEALTGASAAALTVYDMCKAVSHDIEITRIRLMEKTGGKKDFSRNE